MLYARALKSAFFARCLNMSLNVLDSEMSRQQHHESRRNEHHDITNLTTTTQVSNIIYPKNIVTVNDTETKKTIDTVPTRGSCCLVVVLAARRPPFYRKEWHTVCYEVLEELLHRRWYARQLGETSLRSPLSVLRHPCY